MEIANIIVNKTSGSCTTRLRIPAGMTGATVRVVFEDPIWDRLTKTIVFRSNETRIAEFDGSLATIPWEVLQYPGSNLLFGIWGQDSQTDLQLPLIEVPIGVIEPATDVNADPGADPTLPIWSDLDLRMETLEQNLDAAVETAIQTYLEENPPSSSQVDLTGYATEVWVQEGYQPKGTYLTEHQDISGKLDVNYAQTFTQTQQAQARQNISAVSLTELTEELAKRGQVTPEFAQTIEECTDTTKLYVLPDGYIYAYMLHEDPGGEPLFTNLADYSSDDWKAENQFSSTGGLSPYEGLPRFFVSNAIPCHGTDILRIKGCFNLERLDMKACLYTAETATTDNRDAGPVFLNRPYDYNGGTSNVYVGNHVTVTPDPDDGNFNTYAWEIWRFGSGEGYNYHPADSQYWLRIAGEELGELGKVIVTINEEIAYSEPVSEYRWVNTGLAFVPADYEDRILALEYKVNHGDTGESAFDFTQYGLPILYLNGDVSSMTKETEVTLDYVYGDQTGTCTVKWQGSSSLSFPKKNYTVKFDNGFEAVEGWGVQKKYCMKADYMDFSHSRNICSAKLWGQVVKSRANVMTELSALPNGGAVDGFPIVIAINNSYQGIYTFNIPKDGWMFGMGSGTSEAILCADKYSEENNATLFQNEALCDGTDFELEYVSDENDTSWVAESLNQLINAVQNSDGTDIDTTIAQYLDIESAIDHMLFTMLIHGADNLRKNYILATYDGVKWFFSTYDMDSTFGIMAGGGFWSGGAFKQATGDAEGQYPVLSSMRRHKLFDLLCTYKADAIKERYEALRANVMSEANVAHEFYEWTARIPKPYFDEEPKRWPLSPSSSASNVGQIVTHYMLRTPKIDADVNGL